MAEPDPPEFMTTRELAQLLRVRERKVYALAAEGEIPCRRVTGKLLFPRREVEAWLNGQAPRSQAPEPAPEMPPAVIAGSHDPLFDWAIRASGSGIASFFDGSLDGLDRVRAGSAAAAALHLRGDQPESYNIEQVSRALSDRPFVLLALARRRQGLILGKRHARARSVADLAGSRLIPRQPSAGARLHLDRALVEAGLSLTDFACPGEPARTEGEAAAAVAAGEADWTLGLEAAARQHRLAFHGMIDERFDLAIHRRAYFEPAFQALVRFIAGPDFARRAEALGGYDVTERLMVRWNA